MTRPAPRPADVRRTALALAALVFGLVSPLAFAAQRVVERARGGPGDPLLVVFDLHTSFYWRASTAAWWGGLAAILAGALVAQPRAQRGRDALARAVALVALPLALAIAVAMWRLP